MNMGKFLGQWFLYCVVVSFFTACVTGSTRVPGSGYTQVFHVAGLTAFIGYSLAQAQNSIWRGVTWGVTLKHMLDGLIYGLLTAGTFGWLWPK
jgi:nucleoside recognition membrane protein YjiH